MTLPIDVVHTPVTLPVDGRTASTDLADAIAALSADELAAFRKLASSQAVNLADHRVRSATVWEALGALVDDEDARRAVEAEAAAS